MLTIDPRRHADPFAAFTAAYPMWRKRLRRRIERVYGKLEYIQTWEATRNGWPHVNVLLRSDSMLAHVRELGTRSAPVRSKKRGRIERNAITCPKWRAWLKAHAIEAGFGMIAWVEVVEESSAMAAYLTKVAHASSIADEFVRGAVKKGDQRPLLAPRGFRRLRPSHKLLPPRVRPSGEWIGGIARRASDAFLDPSTGECAPTWTDVDAILAERKRRAVERQEARKLAAELATSSEAILKASIAWEQRIWLGPSTIPPRKPRGRHRRVGKAIRRAGEPSKRKPF